ncbi:PREDICTED: 65-kDa microtubule-associated protein 1-like [Nelumbo nucifera]|uniref:65-kDa microtubule-associated protein 1-like n=1 Tax=Nelumbo nucifera TaxID=4432 RepID=A0A1U8QA26_NELNU|nr:PREDICTED: 65-kDa microtubule-associated protein 1-like [Nelumbo nucifera]
MQQIWDEVGESEEERDKMLLQLEQKCLDVYKRKVDQAVKSREQLLQALDNAQSELSNLLSALGEKKLCWSCIYSSMYIANLFRFPHGYGLYVLQPEKTTGTIREQLAAIAPVLEKLWKQKEERIKEISDVQLQIQKICGEIAGNLKLSEQVGPPTVDEADLSLRKLDENFMLNSRNLEKKSGNNPLTFQCGRMRLHKVLDFVSTVHDLCAVLGMDFFSTITEVHPSLNDSVETKGLLYHVAPADARIIFEENQKEQGMNQRPSSDLMR